MFSSGFLSVSLALTVIYWVMPYLTIPKCLDILKRNNRVRLLQRHFADFHGVSQQISDVIQALGVNLLSCIVIH